MNGEPLSRALLERLAGDIAAEIEAKVASGEAIDPDLVRIPPDERKPAALKALIKVVGGEKVLADAERNNSLADELLTQAQRRVQHRVAEAIYVGLVSRHLDVMRTGLDGYPRRKIEDLSADMHWFAQVACSAAFAWHINWEEG